MTIIQMATVPTIGVLAGDRLVTHNSIGQPVTHSGTCKLLLHNTQSIAVAVTGQGHYFDPDTMPACLAPPYRNITLPAAFWKTLHAITSPIPAEDAGLKLCNWLLPGYDAYWVHPTTAHRHPGGQANIQNGLQVFVMSVYQNEVQGWVGEFATGKVISSPKPNMLPQVQVTSSMPPHSRSAYNTMNSQRPWNMTAEPLVTQHVNTLYLEACREEDRLFKLKAPNVTHRHIGGALDVIVLDNQGNRWVRQIPATGPAFVP